MTWTEFREFVALCAIGLGAVAASVLTVLAILVVAGASIGATAGAAVWAFQAVAGAGR